MPLEKDRHTDDSCPAPAAHTRLNDAHRSWHQAMLEYGDPDGFRINLNSCIQTLRSVTFVLQKQKSNIPNFDEWYPIWQSRLKGDAILNWLVEARDRIVHEGDLETNSIVRVAMVTGYFEPPYKEFIVSPMASTQQIAKEIVENEEPDTIKKCGILRVERRWVSKDLPDHELLDALAHAYAVLSNLVNDAHSQAGVPGCHLHIKCEDGKCRPVGFSTEHLHGRLPCMIATEWSRTQWLKLPTGEFLHPSFSEIEGIPLDEAIARYGLASTLKAKKDKAKDLLGFGEVLFEQAKRIFQVDGYLITTAFLILPDKKVMVIQLMPEDREDKYVLYARLASEVERMGANAVIFISENWMAPFDPKFPDRPAIDSPERLEALGLDAISSSGEEFGLACLFKKHNGLIEFEDTVSLDKISSFFLAPVKRVWLKNKLQKVKSVYKKFEVARNSPCPCRSGKKFKKCCSEPLKVNAWNKARELFDKGEYSEAEVAFRSWLTQYIIWYQEQTVPFLTSDLPEATELLLIDIEAVSEIIDSIINCLVCQGRTNEIQILLNRSSDIIIDDRFLRAINHMREKYVKTKEIGRS